MEGAIVVRLDGRLDAITTPLLERGLEKVHKEGGKRVLLDCTSLVYLSSAGLRLLLAFFKRLKREGGFFALFGLADEVKEVVEVAGFHQILPIFVSEQQALSHMP